MNGNSLLDKRAAFEKLYYTGKYNQKQISEMIGISEQSIIRWVRELPVVSYLIIRDNLTKELVRLSRDPGKDPDLIFKYVETINTLDIMVRKAKFTPKM